MICWVLPLQTHWTVPIRWPTYAPNYAPLRLMISCNKTFAVLEVQKPSTLSRRKAA